MNTNVLKTVLTLVLVCSCLLHYAVADEIVISGNEHAVPVGDFDFSPCNTGSAQGALAVLCESTNGEMTAGDLWKFFSDRGIDSVENLTICMDWAPSHGLANDIDLSSLQLKIEDPSRAGSLLTNVSLGGNSLVVPSFEVSSFKPEAKLGVYLGYDFMKRFGPDSTEKVHLDFGDHAQAGFLPMFSFEGSAASPGRIPNWFGLVGFVAFWAIAFKFLAKMTAPKNNDGALASEPGKVVSA